MLQTFPLLLQLQIAPFQQPRKLRPISGLLQIPSGSGELYYPWCASNCFSDNFFCSSSKHDFPAGRGLQVQAKSGGALLPAPARFDAKVTPAGEDCPLGGHQTDVPIALASGEVRKLATKNAEFRQPDSNPAPKKISRAQTSGSWRGRTGPSRLTRQSTRT